MPTAQTAAPLFDSAPPSRDGAYEYRTARFEVHFKLLDHGYGCAEQFAAFLARHTRDGYEYCPPADLPRLASPADPPVDAGTLTLVAFRRRL